MNPGASTALTPPYTPLALDSFDLPASEVRERFRTASTNGTPRWLWPDLPVRKWQFALEQIAAVAQRVIERGETGCVLEGDPTALGIASYTSGMGPLLGHWSSTGQIAAGPSLAAILDLHLRHNTVRMARLLARTRAVSEALRAAGVRHVLLKGMHTAHAYFPQPGARSLADVDLLIDGLRRSEAADVLRHMGLYLESERTLPDEQTWRWDVGCTAPRSLSLVHQDDPVAIDLHFSLDRRYAAGSPIIRFGQLLDDAAIARSSPVRSACVLPQPMLLLYLAVHASCGLVNMSLLRLVELKLVVRQDLATGRLCWNELLKAGERTGTLGAAYGAFKFCEALFPGTVPLEVGRRGREAAPASVHRILDGLDPANAHRMLRCSLAERFMWAPTPWAIARQAAGELFPPGSTSLRTLASIYRTRLFRVIRRTTSF